MVVAAQIQKFGLSSIMCGGGRRDHKLYACAIMGTTSSGFLGLWLWSGGDVLSASDFHPKSFQADFEDMARSQP